MQKIQAQNIVKETLQNDFNKERFLYFVKNLLNKIDESKYFHAHGLVPEAYKNFIKTYERLATYTDPEGSKIDILIVYLQKQTSLERARTAQRNFIARYLKDRDQKDAGLIAFVSPNPVDWRFSLVKMEYKFTENKLGITKIKEEFTPAKRWSFLVGKNENSHTAQSRLAPILEDDQTNLTLKQLEDAFNIEKVTKEFFEKYRELFLRVYETLSDVIKHHPDIKADFTEKNVNTVDFSKKLLGQIVFLYFLQKKGWFGVSMNKGWGDGDKKFLRTLFKEAVGENKNYFNDYLEPLFYEALAKERDDDFYSRFECKIPFLNGGLFDPISNYDWVNTVIDLPNDIFSNTRKTKNGDIGDGILDIFDRYNFTVKEDEPLEKEVAIDPEMLGKVFENLLEVKDRKSKGTYYTPREIVHYMCEQSLINYLATELEGKVSKEDLERLIKIGENVAEHEAISITKEDNPGYGGDYKRLLPDTIKTFSNEIDDKLVTIKVCDPAIGSGAFLVGMMNAIIKVRIVLSSYLKDKSRTPYTFKRDCIQNSLYGVDIDPGAVEIAKLRLWLSLVVDEDNIKQIKPLPNLDYKIMQGNSLLEEFEGVKLFDEKLLEIPIINAQIFEVNNQKIISLQSELLKYYAKNPEWMKKKDIARPEKVLNLEIELRTLLKKTKYIPEGSLRQKDLFTSIAESKQIRDELESLHKRFFSETNKKNKDEIKKQIENLEWELIETTLKEQNKISALKKLEEFKRSNTKPFFLWKLNFADVFEENGGFDVVIANPPYVNVEQIDQNIKDNIKNFRTAYQKYDLYVLFYEKSIDLIRPSGVLSFITSNKFLSQGYGLLLRQEFLKYTIQKIINFNYDIFDSATVRTCIFQLFKLPAKADNLIKIINIETEDDGKKFEAESYGYIKQNIFNETEENNFRINLTDIKLKVLNKIKIDTLKIENICSVNYGLRPSSEKLGLKKKSFIYESNIENKFKAYFEGKDMGYWSVKKISYIDYKPNVMYNPMFVELFENEKLVGLRTLSDISKLRFIYDNTGLYCNDSVVVLTQWYRFKNVEYQTIKRLISKEKINISNKYSLKYLQSILNSKLIKFYVNEVLYDGTHFYPNHMKQLPIKKSTKIGQKPFIDLVNKILEITKSDNYLENTIKQAKVKEYEKQIDQMVYKLYGLTSEEIKIIENGK
jgi:hypothetical protein